MPIVIYHEDSPANTTVICRGIWDLPTQLDELQEWIEKEGQKLKPSGWIADIGFKIRDDASGGGGVLEAETLMKMGKLGLSIYFSEYQ